MKKEISTKQVKAAEDNQILTLRDFANRTDLSVNDPDLELIQALFNQPRLRKFVFNLEDLDPIA